MPAAPRPLPAGPPQAWPTDKGAPAPPPPTPPRTSGLARLSRGSSAGLLGGGDASLAPCRRGSAGRGALPSVPL